MASTQGCPEQPLLWASPELLRPRETQPQAAPADCLPEKSSVEQDMEASELPPHEIVQRYLRKEAILYINAAKAMAGLFGRHGRHNFDFVIHREETSWLVFAGQPTAAALHDMREWERIFGPGFTAVVANVQDEETPVFRTLDGERISLE